MVTVTFSFLAPLVLVFLGVAIHMAMIIILTMPMIIQMAAMMVTLMGASRQAAIMDQARAW
jgi:hypothetical protein